MADEMYSALPDGGGLAAADEFAVARSGSSLRVTPIGVPVLVYRYTVTGSDKASIDTGADTPDAGSNDWTNGDLLEVFLVARTDEAAAATLINVFVNNDTGANYDTQEVAGANGTVSALATLASTAGWRLYGHGSSGSAGYPGAVQMSFPDYAGTTFNKVANVTAAVPDSTAASNRAVFLSCGWRSTAAITRLKLAAVGTAKLKVGSQLLIYKRLAS